MKKILSLLVLLSILNAQEKGVRKFLVGASIVKKGYVAEYVYAVGRVTSDKEALVYPSMPGKLIKYLVKEGARVKKDQVIALLDRDIPGVKTEPLKVKSPIDGIVAIEYGKVGQMMIQSSPVALVIGDKKWIEFGVSSKDFEKIKVGQDAFVETERGEFKGKVVRKSHAIDPMSGVAKLNVEVYDGDLILGSWVNVKIAVNKKQNTMYVPLEAIVERGDKTLVFKYSGGMAEAVEVETGIQGEGIIEIKGNLQPGDTVITLGAEGLYNGAEVDIKGEVK